MAIPSTGQLFLKDDILCEVRQNNTGSNPSGPGNNPSASLHQMSVESSFSTPDAMGDFYGYVSAEPPTTTTIAGGYVADDRIRACGNVLNPTGVTTCYGFYFGSSGTRTSNPFYAKGNSTSTNFNFNCTFTGIPASTTRYYWAYACNVAGTSAGNRCQGTTCQAYTYGISQCGYRIHAHEDACTTSTINCNTNQNHCTHWYYTHIYFGNVPQANFQSETYIQATGGPTYHQRQVNPAPWPDTICVCSMTVPTACTGTCCVRHGRGSFFNLRSYQVGRAGYFGDVLGRRDGCYIFNINQTTGGHATPTWVCVQGANQGMTSDWGAYGGYITFTYFFTGASQQATACHGGTGTHSDIRLKTNINYL